jgi:hypothetical protein
MKKLFLVLTLLTSVSASAGQNIVSWPGYTGSNPIYLVQSNPLGVYPLDMQSQWTAWRTKAVEFAERVAKDERIAKQVGEKMDRADIRCLTWKHLANSIITWTEGQKQRFKAAGKPLPAWIVEGRQKAEERRDEHCSDKNGPGGTREKNLGHRYAEAVWDGADGGELKQEVTKELSALARLVAAGKDLASVALSGQLAPASIPLPIINPELFMPRADRDDYQL